MRDLGGEGGRNHWEWCIRCYEQVVDREGGGIEAGKQDEKVTLGRARAGELAQVVGA